MLFANGFPTRTFSFDATKPGTPLIDNQCGQRLTGEIDFVPRGLEEGVRAHINEARTEAGLAAV